MSFTPRTRFQTAPLLALTALALAGSARADVTSSSGFVPTDWGDGWLKVTNGCSPGPYLKQWLAVSPGTFTHHTLQGTHPTLTLGDGNDEATAALLAYGVDPASPLPSRFWMYFSLAIGSQGTGIFDVLDGAALVAGDHNHQGVHLGANPGSHGTLRVSGDGSRAHFLIQDTADSGWHAEMVIGLEGTGVIEITDGGHVVVQRKPLLYKLLLAAWHPGSHATLSVDGADSLFDAGVGPFEKGAGTFDIRLSRGGVADIEDLRIDGQTTVSFTIGEDDEGNVASGQLALETFKPNSALLGLSLDEQAPVSTGQTFPLVTYTTREGHFDYTDGFGVRTTLLDDTQMVVGDAIFQIDYDVPQASGANAVTATLIGDCATVESLGAGCAGSFGVTPELSVIGCPQAGGTFTYKIHSDKGGAQALLLFGLGSTTVPSHYGCCIYVAPLLSAPVGPLYLTGNPTTEGSLVGSLALPSVTPFSFAMQALVMETWLEFAFTNGVKVSVP